MFLEYKYVVKDFTFNDKYYSKISNGHYPYKFQQIVIAQEAILLCIISAIHLHHIFSKF